MDAIIVIRNEDTESDLKRGGNNRMITYQKIAMDTNVSIAIVKAVKDEYNIKHRITNRQIENVYSACSWISKMRDDLVEAYGMKTREAEKEAFEDWVILRSEGINYNSIF